MEREFVEWLRGRAPQGPYATVGLGDDAAVLNWAAMTARGAGGLVVTTDLITDGVHFLSAEHSLERIGRKALAVNLSDIAAMAATPLAAFVSIVLPTDGVTGIPPLDVGRRLYEGMLPLAEEFGLSITGGDTNVGPGPLTLAVTALGSAHDRGPLTRNGGKAGDWLMVTGELGGSLLGSHLDFTPRVAEALLLTERYRIHAGMDITDGLAIDLSRLAEASRVGAVLELDRIPISRAAEESARREDAARLRSPLEHALGDGEDFELLLAAPPAEAKRILDDQPLACGITRIGELTSEPQLLGRAGGAPPTPLAVTGYLHGVSAQGFRRGRALLPNPRC